MVPRLQGYALKLQPHRGVCQQEMGSVLTTLYNKHSKSSALEAMEVSLYFHCLTEALSARELDLYTRWDTFPLHCSMLQGNTKGWLESF